MTAGGSLDQRGANDSASTTDVSVSPTNFDLDRIAPVDAHSCRTVADGAVIVRGRVRCLACRGPVFTSDLVHCAALDREPRRAHPFPP